MSIALNLYEIFIHGYPVRKNKKYLLFFSVRVTFFLWTVQPTKIVMNTVYRLLIKSNGYTVKKSRFNFFW
jgi:hypothetical protein